MFRWPSFAGQLRLGSCQQAQKAKSAARQAPLNLIARSGLASGVPSFGDSPNFAMHRRASLEAVCLGAGRNGDRLGSRCTGGVLDDRVTVGR